MEIENLIKAINEKFPDVLISYKERPSNCSQYICTLTITGPSTIKALSATIRQKLGSDYSFFRSGRTWFIKRNSK